MVWKDRRTQDWERKEVIFLIALTGPFCKWFYINCLVHNIYQCSTEMKYMVSKVIPSLKL